MPFILSKCRIVPLILAFYVSYPVNQIWSFFRINDPCDKNSVNLQKM